MRTPRLSLGTFGTVMMVSAASLLLGASGSAVGGTSTSVGSSAAIDNRAPSVAMNFAVSRYGIFGTGVAVRMFAFPLPEEWDACDGHSIPRAGNSLLYNQIGDTYGGDGSTYFNLPDLRGRTPVGAGQGGGLQAVSVGQYLGSDEVSLNIAHLPQHVHVKPFGGVTGSAGSLTPLPFENRQASTGLRQGIAISGVFPMRPLPAGGEVIHTDPSERGSLPGCPSSPYYSQIFTQLAVPTTSMYDVCDGKTVNIATNTALFSLVGTQYGGNGVNTFALPDLRGRTGTGVSGNWFDIGVKRGADFVTLSETNLPAHTHELGTFGPCLASGGDQPVENRQPTLDITYCIVTQGVYPSVGFDDLYIYVGEVYAMASTFAPAGTLPCDGRILNVADYDVLAGLIGNRFGGNGVTTFALPDLRGRLPIGAHAGLQLGTVVGQASTTLAESQMPAHTHQFTPPCAGDLNFDGQRDTADLVTFLGAFGLIVTPGTLGDLSGDGVVNTLDLTMFLGRFGEVCPG